jgi:hypothetical protein
MTKDLCNVNTVGWSQEDTQDHVYACHEEIRRLRAELIDTYLEAFYEIAHDEGDGWYSTNARQTCVWHGDRLVELGVFEEDQSRGVGRVRYYRPKAAIAAERGKL